jgi:hypothetical protein
MAEGKGVGIGLTKALDVSGHPALIERLHAILLLCIAIVQGGKIVLGNAQFIAILKGGQDSVGVGCGQYVTLGVIDATLEDGGVHVS